MFREEENFPFSFGTWSLKGCFMALNSVFAVTMREQGWTDDVSPSCWCPRGWRSWNGRSGPAIYDKGNNYSWGLV